MVVIRCDRSIASRLPSAAQFSAQSMTKGSLSSLRDCPGTLVFSRRPVVLEGVGNRLRQMTLVSSPCLPGCTPSCDRESKERHFCCPASGASRRARPLYGLLLVQFCCDCRARLYRNVSADLCVSVIRCITLLGSHMGVVACTQVGSQKGGHPRLGYSSRQWD